jgi:CheY-like chemotaxis protein
MIRVLHVDDDSDIREVVKIALDLDRDFVTRSCASGREALEVAEQWPPDMIVLDVMMPVMDGPATLARLKGNERTAGIPVVFMTARAQSRELDCFRSSGADGVICKPFDPLTLAASLRCYVRPAEDWLDSTRGVFLLRVKEDAVVLKGHRSALGNEAISTASLARIRDIAHGLAGAASIFGFSEIGNAAAVLEEAVVVDPDSSHGVENIMFALERLLVSIETNTIHRNDRPHSNLNA